MKIGHIATFAVCVFACSLFASPALAQTPEEEAALGFTYLTSTSTSGLTTTIGGIVLTIVLANSGKKSALKYYIRDNAVAVKQDVTLGGGDTVADMAQIFGAPLEETSAFARALRSRNAELVALIGTEPIDDDRTQRFIDIVLEAVSTDEELARAIATDYMGG